MFAGIDAVVFDFDNTLIDATDAICHSFNAALEAVDRPPLPRPAIEALIGRPLRAMFAAVDPSAGPEALQRYLDHYRAVFLPISLGMSRALPGLQACLDALHPRRRLGIATNRTVRGAIHILDGFGLRRFFDAVVGIDHVEHTKPHPEPVLKTLDALATPPHRALMVGDTPVDMEAGRAAGTHPVGITTGVHSTAMLREAGAEAVIASLGELPSLLDD